MKITALKAILSLLVLIALNTNCKDNCNSPEGDQSTQTSFGIVSETATNKLQIVQDSFIGTFQGGEATFDDFTQDALDMKEGLVSLKSTVAVDASRGGFAGWFVS